MNNEETIIMQPKNNEKAQQIQSVETPKQEEKKSGNGKKVAAMTGAAVFGGAAGGAGTAAAANMFNKEQEEEQEQEVKVEEDTPTATTTAKPEPKVEEKVETEEIPVTVDENGETDYTGNAGADPVTQNPTSTPQPTGNDGSDAHEVQVLGVYENGEGQELVILTDGERGGAVLDATGNGEGDLLWVDGSDGSTPDGMMQEGEVIDITEQHIQMSQYEDAYLAQQQEQMQQEHETFAYNADDQQDYNNDAPDLSFA